MVEAGAPRTSGESICLPDRVIWSIFEQRRIERARARRAIVCLGTIVSGFGGLPSARHAKEARLALVIVLRERGCFWRAVEAGRARDFLPGACAGEADLAIGAPRCHCDVSEAILLADPARRALIASQEVHDASLESERAFRAQLANI